MLAGNLRAQTREVVVAPSDPEFQRPFSGEYGMHLFDRGQWLLVGGLILSAGGLMAQEYPNRVVRIVVGDAPGSSSDIAMRLLSLKLTEAWGQQVVVDNRPGANGIIGADVVAKAKPDGYTLLSGFPSILTMNQFVYKKLPYDSLRDFAPITQIATNHFALVVTPSLPAISVAALVKLAKSRPGEMFFGSSGIGNQNHLAVEMFARAAGIQLVHVPHKGTAPALIDLMSGQVAMMLVAAVIVAPHIASGKMRLLATAGPQRASAFPDAPTLVELGYPDVVVVGWTGLVAPMGTPLDIRNKLSRDIGRVLAAPDVRATLAVRGSELTSSTPEAFGVFIKAEIEKWSKVIRAVGLENSQ
jgi:tripartite-type tricarboxylate transporter receptor subunit TctC